jgi:hypothetical protein
MARPVGRLPVNRPRALSETPTPPFKKVNQGIGVKHIPARACVRTIRPLFFSPWLPLPLFKICLEYPRLTRRRLEESMISSGRRPVIGVSTERPPSSFQRAGVPCFSPQPFAQLRRNHHLSLGTDEGAIGSRRTVILPPNKTTNHRLTLMNMDGRARGVTLGPDAGFALWSFGSLAAQTFDSTAPGGNRLWTPNSPSTHPHLRVYNRRSSIQRWVRALSAQAEGHWRTS